MLRLYHLIIGSALVALVPLGIKYSLPHLSEPKTVQTTPVVQASKSPNSTEVNIWKKILGKTTAPSGWQVAPCEGNAPLLCVFTKGKLLGTVEIGIYPLEKNPDFQKKLLAAGIPPNTKVDYQNPKYQTQLLTALRSWVTDYYNIFSKDRQASYGNQIVFSAHPPQPVTIGKLQGMRYGFTGINQQNGVQEQHIGHVAFDGSALYVISSAFDPASETGKFDKLEDWTIFQPYLYAIAADLHLPK
ncbi:MAG: hypothetical protein KME32_05900 [Mojavia pulchra JT2-VF2]|jgi:hypothetical protein|uniref:Uncharacterized protein n=1 Tax=Mojavia pulchra JT2-VF2 TaxID=287848 RepID=A0A951PUY1_9NOST|nr:hypothetical protein [Mojavia pulchra JT2-VF2]